MQCVILAGGKATRLGKLTETQPKNLLPIEGRPFADYQLRLLREQGVERVVYCIGHLGEQIANYVGNGQRWDLTVDYVDERDGQLGTAGALRRAFDLGVLSDWFLVTYGDAYLRLDLGAMRAAFLAASAPAMMAVYRNQGRWDRSNVDYADGRVQRYENDRSQADGGLQFIDFGISALDRALVASLAREQRADLSEVYARLSREGRLAGYETYDRFYEIGSLAGLADFRDWVRRGGAR